MGFVRALCRSRCRSARRATTTRRPPRRALVHARGLYLIGRVVVFEDPVLSLGRPDLAARRSDGSVWRDAAGLGWTEPLRTAGCGKYNVDIASRGSRAGFDEILFNYVRFPSDGDVEAAVYRTRGRSRSARRCRRSCATRPAACVPLGVRVSAAVFGLSAAGPRDRPAPAAHGAVLDHVYPMTYPSLFGQGELGLPDPGATPRSHRDAALRGFERRLAGAACSSSRGCRTSGFENPYRIEQVREQIEAARRAGAKGYLLWNAEGVYTDGAFGTVVGLFAESHGANRSLRAVESRVKWTRSCSRLSRCVQNSTTSGWTRYPPQWPGSGTSPPANRDSASA